MKEAGKPQNRTAHIICLLFKDCRPKNDTNVTIQYFWNGQCFECCFKCVLLGQFVHECESAGRGASEGPTQWSCVQEGSTSALFAD